MTIANVRALIPDRPTFAKETFTADGTQDYPLENRPLVEGSVKVYVAGSLKTSGYSIDSEQGVVSFATAPRAGQAIVVTSSHTLLSDSLLQTLLDLEEDDFMAAADAVDAIATDHGLTHSYLRLGDLMVDGSRAAQHIREHARALRATAAEQAGFETAEVVQDVFSARERLRDEALRNLG